MAEQAEKDKEEKNKRRLYDEIASIAMGFTAGGLSALLADNLMESSGRYSSSSRVAVSTLLGAAIFGATTYLCDYFLTEHPYEESNAEKEEDLTGQV